MGMVLFPHEKRDFLTGRRGTMRISAKRASRIMDFICILFLMLPLTAFGAEKVVVIPLFDGDCASGTCKPLKNIVTVAKAGGMFTDPVAAMHSITDANETNPYLVVIGPGGYTVTAQLTMKEWVDIAGSGENVTKIKGAISTVSIPTSAIVSGSNNAALSSLTVENTGGSNYSVASFNSASPRLANVTFIASGGAGGNFGIYNYSSAPVITDVAAIASGPGPNFGVLNYSSSSVMTRITARASGGSENYGVFNPDFPLENL